MKTLSKNFLLIVVATIIVSSFSIERASAVSCADLTSNLYYGDTSPQVLVLQNYLLATGYLTATPNGHFGPSTVVALKKFQSAYKISTTGTAGPLTRTAIWKLSCATTPSTPTTSNTTQTATSTTVVATTSPLAISITTPRAGETLIIGKQYTIQWNGPANISNYTLLLEDKNGVGAGYIAIGSFVGNQYVWKIGSTLSLDQQFVAPGTYRIHIVDTRKGAQSSDQKSDPFTIAAAPLIVTNIIPSSAPSDDNTTVVLYGSGFTFSSSISFDGLYGPTARTLYSSPDGRVLLFTVPTNISAGQHTLQVRNRYASSATTTTGNTINITITNPLTAQ